MFESAPVVLVSDVNSYIKSLLNNDEKLKYIKITIFKKRDLKKAKKGTSHFPISEECCNFALKKQGMSLNKGKKQ